MSQMEMPMMGTVKGMTMVDESLISLCKNRLDAIRLCYRMSGESHSNIAQGIFMSESSLTRILKGTRHLPARMDDAFMRACKNYAPMQYSAWANGFDLVEKQKDSRIRELEAQLAQLRATG